MTIETDRVVNPQREKLGGDPRDLGLRLDRLEWIAVERSVEDRRPRLSGQAGRLSSTD